MQALLLISENGGPTMLARIGVMRALNRHVERVFDSTRKTTHWGKRKLARDREVGEITQSCSGPSASLPILLLFLFLLTGQLVTVCRKRVTKSVAWTAPSRILVTCCTLFSRLRSVRGQSL
jgi:hypothetical protein